VAALEQAAKDLAYRQLRREADEEAAFPVRVEVQYIPREPSAAQGSGALPPALPTPPAPSGGSTVVGGGRGTGGGASQELPEESGGGGLLLLPPERALNTPETLAPPFPFRSLVLAYLFLIPMNFVVQAYGAGSARAAVAARPPHHPPRTSACRVRGSFRLSSTTGPAISEESCMATTRRMPTTSRRTITPPTRRPNGSGA
jgi:hypothetical protein